MSKELKIYRRVGELDVEITNQPDLIIDNFTCHLPHLNSRRITAEFEYPRLIDFQLNEYVIYEKEGEFLPHDEDAFEKYYLVKPPVVTKDEKSLMVKYSIEFVSKFEVLKSVVMVDSWEVLGSPDASVKPSLLQTEYSFFGGVNEYFTNIKSSMIAEFGSEVHVTHGTQPKGWIIEVDLNNGYEQEVDDMQVSVSQMTVFDALVDINDKFKVPFFFKGSNHIVIGGAKLIVSKQFRYGKDKGLVKIVKTPKDMSIINKIRGVGSERNIPYNYLASIKSAAGLPELPMNKLMPKIYRDTLELKAAIPSTQIKDYYTLNYNEDFPKPAFETFDDIYPTITGAFFGEDSHPIDEITGVYFLGDDVEDENLMIVNGESQEPKHPRFWVRIPALGFDLNSCLNEKEPLLLTMTEGLCGGCKFKVAAIGANPKRWAAFNEGYSDLERMLIESKNVTMITKSTSTQEFVSNEVECFDGDLLSANLKFKLGLDLGRGGISQFRGEVFYEFGFYINGVKNAIFSGTYDTDTSTGNIEDEHTLDSSVFSITEDNQGVYKAYVYLSAENQYVGSGTETYFKGAFYVAFDDISVVVEHSAASKESVDTTNNPTWLLLQKDIETYNTTLPYVTSPIWSKYPSPEEYPKGPPSTAPTGLVPKIGQKFVFFGISLPDAYIISAEQRLEDALESILLQNQEYKFNYDTVFDEKIFLESPELLNEVVPGATIEIFEETRPRIVPSQGEKIEVVINGLTLKYSSSKSITINAD